MLRQALITATIFLALSVTANARQGDVSEDWTLTTVDGENINLKTEVEQQATVIFFWASWCPYCKALMPHLQSMRFEYGDKVKILAITIFEDGDPVSIIEDAGYDFTLLLDGDIEAGQYGITGTPGVLILDKNLVIQFDMRELPRIDVPDTALATGHRQKAAYKAPYWAAEIRKSLDAVMAENYSDQ